MNSGSVPNSLVIGARAGFLRSPGTVPPLWHMVANQLNLNAKYADLVDLGGAPMPVKSKSGLTMQDFSERYLRVAPQDWDVTVHVTFNAFQDDQTGQIMNRAKSAFENFDRHINKVVFDALNQGEATTAYGAAYDGLPFFSTAHVDKGAAYQTVQSNKNTLALTPDNFETAYVAGSTRLDDQGEQTGYVPDLLVVPPALDRLATQITGNPNTSGTPNNDINTYYGKVKHITVPYIDTTAWFLLTTSTINKPLILVMRQMPFLQDYWFDREKPDGGWYCFKYFGRYNVAYGDPRLAVQGNT